MAVAARWCDTYDGAAADPADAVRPLFLMLLGYAIGCQITLTLTNVISFRNLDDRKGTFWYVRLVGTFGWIVACFVVGWVLQPVPPLYQLLGRPRHQPLQEELPQKAVQAATPGQCRPSPRPARLQQLAPAASSRRARPATVGPAALAARPQSGPR